MDAMSADPEIRARLMKAGRDYTRAKDAVRQGPRWISSLRSWTARKEGTLIEDIAADVPYRQTQVNRVLEAAGLTEKRAKTADS